MQATRKPLGIALVELFQLMSLAGESLYDA
jgi:hypothetical protein